MVLMKKIDYKDKFLKLTQKTYKEFKHSLKFFPKEKFLITIYKEHQQLVADGKKIKNKKDYKKAYDYACDIMLRHDHWHFDGNFFVKTIKKPELSTNIYSRNINSQHYKFDCGDLYLRNKIDSSKDIFFSLNKLKYFFKNDKRRLNKFTWIFNYSFPRKNEHIKLKKTQKFGHNISFKTLDIPIMTFNYFDDRKRQLLIPVDLLDKKLDYLVNFIDNLNNLKKIVFKEVSFETTDLPDEYPYISYADTRIKLNNPNFFNYLNINKKLIKPRLRNLYNFKKLLNLNISKTIPIQIECWHFEDENIEYNSYI